MKKLLTAALTALLMACTPDHLDDSDLYGCWRISANLISSYLSLDSDHTYQMMLSEPDKLYDNYGTLEARHEYSDGTWHLEGNTIKLLCNDTIAHILQNVEKGKNGLSFEMKQGSKMWRYGGIEFRELQLSAVTGTWSFTERQVFRGLYDMVMTLDDTYHARMTFSAPNDNHGHDIHDWNGIEYTILGNYIVFTGLTPVHYLSRYTTDDGDIEYTSWNSQGSIARFQAIPQDSTAHTLRLDGFIF